MWRTASRPGARNLWGLEWRGLSPGACGWKCTFGGRRDTGRTLESMKGGWICGVKENQSKIGFHTGAFHTGENSAAAGMIQLRVDGGGNWWGRAGEEGKDRDTQRK